MSRESMSRSDAFRIVGEALQYVRYHPDDGYTKDVVDAAWLRLVRIIENADTERGFRLPRDSGKRTSAPDSGRRLRGE